jgi:hypothetical protein
MADDLEEYWGDVRPVRMPSETKPKLNTKSEASEPATISAALVSLAWRVGLPLDAPWVDIRGALQERGLAPAYLGEDLPFFDPYHPELGLSQARFVGVDEAESMIKAFEEAHPEFMRTVRLQKEEEAAFADVDAFLDANPILEEIMSLQGAYVSSITTNYGPDVIVEELPVQFESIRLGSGTEEH